jgi:hypothetical protein
LQFFQSGDTEFPGQQQTDAEQADPGADPIDPGEDAGGPGCNHDHDELPLDARYPQVGRQAQSLQPGGNRHA